LVSSVPGFEDDGIHPLRIPGMPDQRIYEVDLFLEPVRLGERHQGEAIESVQDSLPGIAGLRVGCRGFLRRARESLADGLRRYLGVIHAAGRRTIATERNTK